MKTALRAISALPLLALVAAAQPAGTPVADVGLVLTGIRNAKGTVQICLTNQPVRFLKCKDDPAALRRSIPAAQLSKGRIALGIVKPGTYALLVFHDENNDGKLNTMLAIPREGFGFSANPNVRMRAPNWEEVRVALPAGPNTQTVRMKYFL